MSLTEDQVRTIFAGLASGDPGLKGRVLRASVRGMRYALISALALGAIAAQAPPRQTTAKRAIPCKAPENAATCYWAHGRLNFYNVAPSYRIWKIGTKHILGVYSGPSTYPPRTDKDNVA